MSLNQELRPEEKKACIYTTQNKDIWEKFSRFGHFMSEGALFLIKLNVLSPKRVQNTMSVMMTVQPTFSIKRSKKNSSDRSLTMTVSLKKE